MSQPAACHAENSGSANIEKPPVPTAKSANTHSGARSCALSSILHTLEEQLALLDSLKEPLAAAHLDRAIQTLRSSALTPGTKVGSDHRRQPYACPRVI